MNHAKKRVLFHRSWTGYDGGTSGGQLKVRDAFEHIKHSDQYYPTVYFGQETVWHDNPGNYWHPYRENALQKWEIKADDVLFFSGKDWKILDRTTAQRPPVPIINIAQPRHTRPEDPRHSYLHYPAIRIAKSSIGKQILEDFGVNGPVFLIPDAIDFSLIPSPKPDPTYDLLIVGLKNPVLAQALYKKLRQYSRWRWKRWKIKIQVPPKLPTRADFLNLVNDSKTVVFLPLDAERGAEGFYLPALEAMVMEKLVVCPKAVGNVDFCLPGKTCLQPDYQLEDLFDTTIKALRMSPQERQNIIAGGRAISENHRIETERTALLELLHQADEIWQDDSLFKTR